MTAHGDTSQVTWRSTLAAFCVAVILALILTGCSSKAEMTANDPVFAGIPPAVVSEVMASPVVRERVMSNSPEMERSLWQGIALNYVQTRDAYSIYTTWRDTGTPPELSADLTVTEQLPGYKDYKLSQVTLREIIASGEIEQLREYLTNQSGGGVWIPAKPNDANGPTVADAIKQGL